MKPFLVGASSLERMSDNTSRPFAALPAQEQQVDIPPLRGVQAAFRKMLNDRFCSGQTVCPGVNRTSSKVFLYDAMAEREMTRSGLNEKAGPDDRVSKQGACLPSGPMSVYGSQCL